MENERQKRYSTDVLLAEFFAQDDLKALAVDAGALLECPLLVLDDTFHVTAHHRPLGFTDPLFQETVRQGQITYEAGAVFSQSDALSAGKADYVKLDGSEYRRRFAPLISSGVRLGYLICVDIDDHLQNIPPETWNTVEQVLAKQAFIETSRHDKPFETAEDTPEEFDKVQTELARRKRISRQYSGKSIFSSRIVCGDCGSYFGSKVWNSTSKYRRVIWQCNGKFKGEHKCKTPHLDEETIKARFVAAINAIIDSKDNILEDCRLMQTTLTDCTGIDTEIESLLEEIDVVAELTKRCIAENSQTAQNQNEYAARYNGFVERYEKAKAQLEQLRATKVAREAQAEAIGAFMFEVQELDALTNFDDKLWLTVIDTVTVHADGRMTFKFQGGTEIEA